MIGTKAVYVCTYERAMRILMKSAQVTLNFPSFTPLSVDS